jgi:transcriptional regulator NrdR family protein
MNCPRCGTWSEVLETRTRLDGSKRRRYECANLHRFSTEERHVAELKQPKSIAQKIIDNLSND